MVRQKYEKSLGDAFSSPNVERWQKRLFFIYEYLKSKVKFCLLERFVDEIEKEINKRRIFFKKKITEKERDGIWTVCMAFCLYIVIYSIREKYKDADKMNKFLIELFKYNFGKGAEVIKEFDKGNPVQILGKGISLSCSEKNIEIMLLGSSFSPKLKGLVVETERLGFEKDLKFLKRKLTEVVK